MKAFSLDTPGAEVARLLAALPVIRPLRPDDRALVDALVRELSPTSRYRRFHAAVNGLPAAMLEGLARVDARDEVARLATTTARGTEVAVGRRAGARRTRSDARVRARRRRAMAAAGRRHALLRELMRRAARSAVGSVRGHVHGQRADACPARQLDSSTRHPFDPRLVP
jgi:hypothetical protein